MTRFHVSAVFVLLAPFALSSAARAQVSPQRQMPPNVSVVPVLMPVFEEIAAVSPTFDAQCARIASAKHVHVVVNAVMASSTTSRGTARTTMRRFASGALLANVEMPVPLTTLEYAELFGHEFEHIIEQIDRVDLDALATVRQRRDPTAGRRIRDRTRAESRARDRGRSRTAHRRDHHAAAKAAEWRRGPARAAAGSDGEGDAAALSHSQDCRRRTPAGQFRSRRCGS